MDIRRAFLSSFLSFIMLSVCQGASELSVAAFRQMCGRAGRLGLDESGEAILIIPSLSRQFKALAVHLVTADMPPLVSSLQVRCFHCSLACFLVCGNHIFLYAVICFCLLCLDCSRRWFREIAT
jgi:hypothetical protein